MERSGRGGCVLLWNMSLLWARIMYLLALESIDQVKVCQTKQANMVRGRETMHGNKTETEASIAR